MRDTAPPLPRSAVLPHLLALALLGALLVACDGSDEDAGTPAATATLAATESATAAPEATPAEVATRPATGLDQQVVIFDVAAGSFTELLSDDRARYFAPTIFPRFTPDGSHVWVTEVDALVSRRYDVSGDSVTTLPGIVLSEQTNERLVYTQSPETDPLVTVRAGDEEYSIPSAAPRGQIVLSPDGEQIAYWKQGPGETVTYEIADVQTGGVNATGVDVGLCQCDGGPAPFWSPSGRYFVYSDFASPPGNLDDPEHGTIALDTETGRRILLSLNPWVPEDLALGGDQWLAERDGSVVVLDATSDTVIRVIAPLEEEGRRISTAGGVVATFEVTRDPYAVRTRIYDLDSSELLFTDEAQLRPLPIENGVAYERQTTGGSISLVHPLLSEPYPFPEGFVLSPDGRYVAATEKGSAIRIYRIESGGLEQIASYERPAAPIDTTILPVEWNAAGTHLLISIGFGL